MTEPQKARKGRLSVVRDMNHQLIRLIALSRTETLCRPKSLSFHFDSNHVSLAMSVKFSRCSTFAGPRTAQTRNVRDSRRNKSRALVTSLYGTNINVWQLTKSCNQQQSAWLTSELANNDKNDADCENWENFLMKMWLWLLLTVLLSPQNVSGCS